MAATQSLQQTPGRAGQWQGQGVTEPGHYHIGPKEVADFARINPIRKKLGEGAFARVYEITDRKASETVACKEFLPSSATSSIAVVAAEGALLLEVEHMRRAQFHHCVQVCCSFSNYGDKQRGRISCIVMRPLADKSLDDLLTEVQRAPRMTAQQSETLMKAFGCLALTLMTLDNPHLIRHKDIKPANILIHGSKVYLSDFGIAHSAEATGRMTTYEDNPRYDYQYAPPECQNDQRAPRTAKSDVFSMGAVYIAILRELSKDEGENELPPDEAFEWLGYSDCMPEWHDKLAKYALRTSSSHRRIVARLIVGMTEQTTSERKSASAVCRTLWGIDEDCPRAFFCKECREYVARQGLF